MNLPVYDPAEEITTGTRWLSWSIASAAIHMLEPLQPCLYCGANPGQRCTRRTTGLRATWAHTNRYWSARALAEEITARAMTDVLAGAEQWPAHLARVLANRRYEEAKTA